ncbi:MAG: ArsR family transcriptional regulator [Pseudomonadota bacterium]
MSELAIPVFKRMRSVSRDVERAQADELKAAILALLAERGPLKVCEICAALNRKPSTIRDYMFRLSKLGKVSSSFKFAGEFAPAVYQLGTQEDRRTSDNPRQCTVRDYPPNKYEDPYHLPTEFFRSVA